MPGEQHVALTAVDGEAVVCQASSMWHSPQSMARLSYARRAACGTHRSRWRGCCTDPAAPRVAPACRRRSTPCLIASVWRMTDASREQTIHRSAYCRIEQGNLSSSVDHMLCNIIVLVYNCMFHMIDALFGPEHCSLLLSVAESSG